MSYRTPGFPKELQNQGGLAKSKFGHCERSNQILFICASNRNGWAVLYVPRHDASLQRFPRTSRPHVALAPQQRQCVMQCVVGIASQYRQRFFGELVPHAQVVALVCRGCVFADKTASALRVHAGFADFADQRGSGFFGEHGFVRASSGHTQQQGEQ